MQEIWRKLLVDRFDKGHARNEVLAGSKLGKYNSCTWERLKARHNYDGQDERN